MKNRLMKSLSVLLFSCFILQAFSAGAADSVSPKVEMENPYILADREQTAYLLIRFAVDGAREGDRRRENLNLGLVIDRSGSMVDRGKLTYAKRAAQDLIGHLKVDDIIGIVEYDDRISVLWPSSTVDDPGAIRRAISTLAPGGSTNLAGGMMEGGREVLRNGLGGIKRVFLMSDGLANVGVTDRHAIARLASSMRRNGVRISTMGLGLDYDEDLMQVVAESGGGSYYFIEHPNQIARIFSEEMGRLDRLVSRDATLEFNWGSMVKRAEVIGYPSSQNGRRTRVNLTDFYQGENRTVLVKLDLAPCRRGKVNIGKLTLGYQDLVDGRNKKISRPVKAVFTRDAAEVRNNENSKVAVESRLIVADQEHEEAVRLYESGKAPEAKEAMAALSQKLTKDMDRYQDAQLQKKLDALAMEKTEIAQAESDESYRKSYLKKRKSAFYSSQKGNRAGYMLQEGANGYQVKDLQKALKKEGIYQGPEDGVFDEEVQQAVEKYQKAKGMPVDGIAGPKTLKGLGLY